MTEVSTEEECRIYSGEQERLSRGRDCRFENWRTIRSQSRRERKGNSLQVGIECVRLRALREGDTSGSWRELGMSLLQWAEDEGRAGCEGLCVQLWDFILKSVRRLWRVLNRRVAWSIWDSSSLITVLTSDNFTPLLFNGNITHAILKMEKHFHVLFKSEMIYETNRLCGVQRCKEKLMESSFKEVWDGATVFF